MANTEPQPGRSRHQRRDDWLQGGVKYSKMYRQRVSDARALRSSLEVFRARVAEGLCERLAPELAEGEALPDFGLSLDLLGRSVESALERLRAAEWQCAERGLELATVRRKSETVARKELYPQVVLVRRLIDTQLGKRAGRDLHGMSGKTLRKARRLHLQLQYLVGVLEADRQDLPDPLLERLAGDREVWWRKIQPGYEQLTELLDKLADLEALEQLARDDKNETIRKFDETYGEARRLLEATFAYAGLAGKLARLLRSYVHRRWLSLEARRARKRRAGEKVVGLVDGPQRAAPAEGQVRQVSRAKQVLRFAASSVVGWIGRRPRSAA